MWPALWACDESRGPFQQLLSEPEGVAERLAPILEGRPGITAQPLETTRRLAYLLRP